MTIDMMTKYIVFIGVNSKRINRKNRIIKNLTPKLSKLTWKN